MPRGERRKTQPAQNENHRHQTMNEEQLRKRIRELEGKLDICRRYAGGEIEDDAGWLANDYGGTGWECDPACLAVGELAVMFKKLHSQADAKIPQDNRE